MEENNPSKEKSNSNVILCKSCLDQGEYTITLFDLDESNKIQYKCLKRHLIGENDIIYVKLDEKLKKKLMTCTNEEHIMQHESQENTYCAWCEKCGENLCYVGVVIEQTFYNHFSFLYYNFIPKFEYEQSSQEKIEKLKSLLDRYSKVCPDAKEEIKYLSEIYEINYINYQLYYYQNIVIYQTNKNITTFNNYSEKIFEKYEEIFKQKRYKYLYDELFIKNSIDKVNKTEIDILNQNTGIILPLIKNSKDKTNKKEIYFGVYNKNKHCLKILIIKEK